MKLTLCLSQWKAKQTAAVAYGTGSDASWDSQSLDIQVSTENRRWVNKSHCCLVTGTFEQTGEGELLRRRHNCFPTVGVIVHMLLTNKPKAGVPGAMAPEERMAAVVSGTMALVSGTSVVVMSPELLLLLVVV